MTNPSENPTYSIIIVTWNALDHIQRFLPAVTRTTHHSFEIIIADNASEDKTSDWIAENYSFCRVVKLDKNYGYCGGNNRAAGYAKGEILVFLNNDAKTDPKWLNGLDESFKNPDVGIVQPKIKSAEEPDYFEYAGAAGGFIDKMGYPFCRGRIFDHVEEDNGQYDTASEIFWASGAAIAIRKELFESLNGFDEDFEFHMEEIDLCWRSHKLGYKVVYEPRSVVFHLGGGSLPMGNPRKVFYNYRNNLTMMTKNLDKNPVFRILGRLFLDGIAGVKALLSGSPKDIWAIIRAHFAFYGMLADTLKKRRELKGKQTVSTPTHLIYQKSIIVEYFLKGKKKFSDLTFH
ncbi:MAG: glycosyltransferase family 2 protein [Rhodohalobacter sp.]|uniref:glycosyltransferase family 2 protein n=1 Tax=Rhodohalobacter sp. TaxID=1974210 RepID=UPI0039755DF6